VQDLFTMVRLVSFYEELRKKGPPTPCCVCDVPLKRAPFVIWGEQN
jgi:hypothetical protein